MEEVIKEGTWKCPNCGKKNRGRDVKCASCGQARENVEFSYDETAPEVTDEAEKAVAEGGPDWTCGYCGTSNRANVETCRQCGGSRGEGKNREVTEVVQEKAIPPRPADSNNGSKGGSGVGRFVLWTILGVFGLCVLLSLWQSDEFLTLSKARWDRVIKIEKLSPVIEEGWSVPAGGRVLSTRQAVYSHSQVQTGTRQAQEDYTEKIKTGTKRVKTGVKNLGNGYFKETYRTEPVYTTRTKTRMVTRPVYTSVPNYRTRYRYEVEKWHLDREVRTSGDNTEPAWGQVTLARNERDAGRSSAYKTTFTSDNGKSYEFVPSEPLFVKLRLGQKCKCRVNGLGGLVQVSEQ